MKKIAILVAAHNLCVTSLVWALKPWQGATMNTIQLTPAVLSTLAEGIRSLNRGDNEMRAEADAVCAEMAKLGLVLSHGAWYPAAEATSGYVAGLGESRGGEWVSQAAATTGEWFGHGPYPLDLKGKLLFLDPECKVFLRIIS